MKIYITGASGFIGGFLAENLGKEHEVIKVTKEEYENISFVKGSIVIHAGAMVHKPMPFNQENVEMFVRVNTLPSVMLAGKAIRDEVKSFIFFSTSLVMGNRSGVFTESTEPKPDTPYAVSKWQAERALAELFANSKTDCIVLRLPMVYGDGAKGNYATLQKFAKAGIPLPLASVRAKRSFVSIDNIIKGISAIIKSDKTIGYGIYNLSDAEDVTSGQLYSQLFRKYHKWGGVFTFPESLLRILAKLPRLGIISKLITEYRFPADKFWSDFR